MASPTLLLAEYLGLEKYDSKSVDIALKSLLQTRQIFPAKQSCVVGGMAVVHYVGKARRKISENLDLLISIQSQHLIKRHFQTEARRFTVPLDCGEMTLNCIGTSDAMEREIISASQIANMAGSLIRVAPLSGLMAMKYIAGRTKDLEDLFLLITASSQRPDHELSLQSARNLIQRHHDNMAESFELELSSALIAIGKQS